MDNQVKQLKLNVTNIKSYLISSNKELRKLKVQKKELFFKLEKKKELKAEESRIESKNLGIGAGFSRLMSVVTAPVRSIFDRILDFFGLIALGILVQKLPDMIAKVEEFFNSDFIKTVGSVFTTIGTGFQKLGELIDLLTPQKQKEIDQDLKATEKESDDGLKMADQSDKYVSELEKELNKREKDNNGSTPPAAPTGPRTPEPSTTQQSPAPTQTNPSPASPRSTPPNSPTQKLSKGGTVQPSNSPQTKAPYQPRKSAQLERAQRGMGNGFEDFSLAVENINQTVQRDEQNVMAFAGMAKNFREYVSLFDKRKGDGKSSGAPGPGNDPNDPGPTPGDGKVFDYEPPTGDATIVIHPGQGRDASGEPGLDFSFKDYKNNYSLFAGEVIGTPVYDGYGQSLRIRSKDPATGKMFDALYAHFPPGGVKVKVGDKVTPGQFLGPVGWDHRNNKPIKGAGNMTGPHTSVDFFEPGTLTPYSNAGGVTTSVIQRKDKKPKGAIKPAQVVQPPSGIKIEPASKDPVADAIKGLSGALQRQPGEGGGNRKLLNNTSSSGNQSLFIYAVQPVETFVPFPYPVPMKQASSSPPQRQRLPEIWRT